MRAGGESEMEVALMAESLNYFFFVMELLSSSRVSNIAALMWTLNHCAFYSPTNSFPPFLFYCFPLIFISLKGFGKFAMEIGSGRRAPVGSRGRVTGLI